MNAGKLRKTFALYEKAPIILAEEEKKNLEITDYALGDAAATGTEIIIYVNTERCCAKEMALLPFQTCPEHRHAPIAEAIPARKKLFAAGLARCFYMWMVSRLPTRRPNRPKEYIWFFMRSSFCRGSSIRWVLIHCTGFKRVKREQLSANFQPPATMNVICLPIPRLYARQELMKSMRRHCIYAKENGIAEENRLNEMPPKVN